jgi:pimeloyl-ACP methyl ester carboxylesterase
VFAGKSIGQVADHFETIIRGLTRKPAIIGHSTGGLLAQILAGRGLAAASVAIDPAPFRGVLLLISGERDHTVPWAIVNASYKQQQDNPGVTEIEKIPGQGHALTIDSGWRKVADKALAFVQRFLKS